jgi:hypothetical protein
MLPGHFYEVHLHKLAVFVKPLTLKKPELDQVTRPPFESSSALEKGAVFMSSGTASGLSATGMAYPKRLQTHRLP